MAIDMATRGSLILLLVHLRPAGSESEQVCALLKLAQRNGDWHPLDGAATFLMMGQA